MPGGWPRAPRSTWLLLCIRFLAVRSGIVRLDKQTQVNGVERIGYRI